MFEELKKMNQELADLKKNHIERAKVMFSDLTKQLFEKHPKLESFSWRQYTPYFNDGDECIFSVYTDYPNINDIGGPYDDPQFDKVEITDYRGDRPANGKWPTMLNPHADMDLAAAEKDVTEFLGNIDDSVYRDMFGDHVMIKVTREGTEVEEYEHD